MRGVEKPMLGTSDEGAVSLPDDAVTQGFAVLARRRSGKSSLAGVIEETFCERGDPWVCLDPVSAHWGIRYLDDNGRPGKPSGYDVMIVGGKYGDVPLDEKAGAALAQIVVDTDISCVVDLGAESMNAQQAFVADFASELLRLNESPRHVLLEEAHVFVPQQATWDNQKSALGALTKMITMGGGKGIGYSLISQKSAYVAKSVLEQIDNLFVMRMSGPRDLKSVQDWFEHNIGDTAEMKRVLGTLRAFQPGEAWWLSDTSLQRLRVRQRQTYHAGRTPKRGEKPVTVKRVELGKVIEQFRSAASKRQIAVREERDIRAELAELRRKLAAAERAKPAPAPPADCGHVLELAALRENRALVSKRLADADRAIFAAAQAVTAARTTEPRQTAAAAPPPPQAPIQATAPAAPRPIRQQSADRGEDLADIEQRILDALAWWDAIGVPAPVKSNVGFIAGYRVGKKIGGAFGIALGELNRRRLIEYPRPGVASLSAAGRALASPPEVAPTTAALHAAIFARLDDTERRVLRAVVDAHPDELDKQTLGESAGYRVGKKLGGKFGIVLGQLRALGLIVYPAPGRVRAAEWLYPEGLAA